MVRDGNAVNTVMPGKTESLDDIAAAFQPILAAGGARRAIIFGSYCRGQADEYSDIDLVILKDTEVPFLDRYTDFKDLFLAMLKAIQVLVYTPDEFEDMRARGNPFILDVIEDGVVIYEAGR